MSVSTIKKPHSRHVIADKKEFFSEFKPEEISGVRGLQVTKQILFEHWKPLQKYTKVIFVYNPSPRMQRFLYEMPKLPVFSLDRPKPMKLSPQKGIKLTVQFTPREQKNYIDKLIIKTAEREKILVKLQARINIAMLLGPQEIHLGICGISQSVEKPFIVQNSSALDLNFSWQVSEPFTIEPKIAIIGARKKISFKAKFTPNSAALYVSCARCKTPNDDNALTVKLIAKAVYPYLYIISDHICFFPKKQSLNFGVVNVNSSSIKEIDIANPLPVRTQFSIFRSPMYNISSLSPFTFSNLTGYVEPLSTLVLKAKYEPNIPDHNDSDVWVLIIHGGLCSRTIHLLGVSQGPMVKLSSKCLDFTETEIGSTLEKVIKITNTSQVETTFQFELDNKQSVFSFDPNLGYLEKDATLIIRVQFRPPYPITYYRRVACIVHLHEPIFLDLVGTAISSIVQPERLQPMHLIPFWTQIRQGQFYFTDELSLLPTPMPKPIPEPIDEYLYDGYHSDFTVTSPPVSLDQVSIDFGMCSAHKISTAVFSVTNHTLFVMTVTWIGGPDHVFHIKPHISAIQPQHTGVFHLLFKPPDKNQVYWGELEGYAHHSASTNDTFTARNFPWAPWCLTIRATGHSYVESRIYNASYKLSNYRIQVKAVPAKSHTSCTVLITNKLPTTKIAYSVRTQAKDVVIKPRNGLISNKFTVVTFGLAPRLPGPYSVCITVDSNLDEASRKELVIEGTACQPKLVLDYPAGLYFKPTCVGMTTKRIQGAHNISPIVVHFTWTMKSISEKILSVCPREGTILPNGIEYFEWSFTPNMTKRYVVSAVLLADTEGTFGIRSYTEKEITVYGEGVAVHLASAPPALDIGALVVGTMITSSFKIHNLSYCDLNIKLVVRTNKDKVCRDCFGQGDTNQPSVLFEDFTRSVGVLYIHLPARCRKTILFCLIPRQHGFYSFKIYYFLLSSLGNGNSHLTTRLKLANGTMIGSHPMLQLSDARFLGSGMKIRKDKVWQLLSINKLNKCLRSEPIFSCKNTEIDESLYPMINSMPSEPKSVKQIYFHLPPATVGRVPLTAILLFSNPGLVKTEWRIWYPWEQKTGPEMWAHSGYYLKNEVDVARMKDNKLIEIAPRKGSLMPGATQFISIVYIHHFASHNLFPIRFCCVGGVEVLINIITDTFGKEIPRIYFPHLVHEFSPVHLGSGEGIVVSYLLYNFSSITLKVKLDVFSLKRLQKVHYNYPVVDCITRRLLVPAEDFVALLWQFWPLEATVYTLEIPIKFDHDSQLHSLTLLAPALPYHQIRFEESEKPKMCPPFQSVILSHERIFFGHIPVCCRLSRIFSMKNLMPFTVKFDWIMPYKLLKNRVVFEPKDGLIQPNSSIMVKLTIHTGHTPAIYDLHCYAELTTLKTTQSMSKQKLTPKMSNQNTSSLTMQNQKMALIEGVLVGDLVTPFALHMELKAQTYLVQDYWKFFPQNIFKYSVMRPRIRPQKDERKAMTRSQQLSDMLPEVRKSIFELMTIFFYEATTDFDFYVTIKTIAKDPIPYYCQLAKSFSKTSAKTSVDLSNSSTSSVDSFDRYYWNHHANVFGRQLSFVSKKSVSVKSDIFTEKYVPDEMKTFPESILILDKVLEEMIWTVLDEAARHEFDITIQWEKACSSIFAPKT